MSYIALVSCSIEYGIFALAFMAIECLIRGLSPSVGENWVQGNSRVGRLFSRFVIVFDASRALTGTLRFGGRHRVGLKDSTSDSG